MKFNKLALTVSLLILMNYGLFASEISPKTYPLLEPSEPFSQSLTTTPSILRSIDTGDETTPLPNPGTATDGTVNGTTVDSVTPVDNGYFIMAILIAGYAWFIFHKQKKNKKVNQ